MALLADQEIKQLALRNREGKVIPKESSDKDRAVLQARADNRRTIAAYLHLKRLYEIEKQHNFSK